MTPASARPDPTRPDQIADLAAWFVGRLPDSWFVGPPEVRCDREEIQVLGTLPSPDLGDDEAEDRRRIAGRARIDGFREETRELRMRIAADAEHLWERKVSWGVVCADERRMFTTAAVPVMTRLRMQERAVLDTLIDAGVARSRSEALAWCVALVAEHQGEWIGQLREALDDLQRVRDDGPS